MSQVRLDPIFVLFEREVKRNTRNQDFVLENDYPGSRIETGIDMHCVLKNLKMTSYIYQMANCKWVCLL